MKKEDKTEKSQSNLTAIILNQKLDTNLHYKGQDQTNQHEWNVGQTIKPFLFLSQQPCHPAKLVVVIWWITNAGNKYFISP